MIVTEVHVVHEGDAVRYLIEIDAILEPDVDQQPVKAEKGLPKEIRLELMRWLAGSDGIVVTEVDRAIKRADFMESMGWV